MQPGGGGRHRPRFFGIDRLIAFQVVLLADGRLFLSTNVGRQGGLPSQIQEGFE